MQKKKAYLEGAADVVTSNIAIQSDLARLKAKVSKLLIN